VRSGAVVGWRLESDFERTDVIKPALYGAVGGAIALAIVGFSWGGWVTGGTDEARVKTGSQTAVVAALAPICASQFRQTPDAAAQQAVLVTKGSWEQKKLVEAGGWAKMPGSTDTDVPSGLAQACADLIVNLKL
jgi:hypothetical protein